MESGFPFFGPAYNPASRLHLFGPGASEQALEELLAHNQQPPTFPVTLRDMNAAKEIRSLTETDIILVGASRKCVNQVMVFFREQEMISVRADGKIIVQNRPRLAGYCR